MLSDGFSEPAVGWRYIWSKIKMAITYIKENWMTLTAIALVVVTVIFLGYQIYIRVRASQMQEDNFVYIGLEQIGDVFLGDEDL